MIRDLVLDTHVLTEFIAQYFECPNRDDFRVIKRDCITEERARLLNRVLKSYYNENLFENGLIITSAFSFIEICRQFQTVTGGRYTKLQLKSFINDLPPYIEVAPIDRVLSEAICDAPKTVILSNGNAEKIELPDAIHYATYLTRDNAFLVTDDGKLKCILSVDVV